MTLAVNIAQSGSSNVTFRNRIINGGMVIDQRNAGASVTPTTATYVLDRWSLYPTQASKLSVQQSTTAPAGFVNSTVITSLSAYSVVAGDFFAYGQRIEGFNVADFGFGTASASTVTLSFWVRSSLTGTFGGSLVNGAATRSYPFTYTISVANTFEYKTITIAGDTSGTWITNNGIGLVLFLGLGVGSTYSGTAGSWSSNYYFSATGATSVVGTSGATFYITGVQLEAGTTASPFEYRQYGTELALCQRYYWKIKGSDGNYACFSSGLSTAGTTARHWLSYPAPMRTAPTISYGGTIYCYDGANLVVTSISVLPGVTSALVDFTGSGGGATSGRGSVGNPATAASDFIQASAEL
jgi:hypothetical protein